MNSIFSPIILPEFLTKEWVEKNSPSLVSLQADKDVVLDCSNTKQIDSAGLALLLYLAKQAKKSGKTIELKNAGSQILKALENIPLADEPKPSPRQTERFFANIGAAFFAVKETATHGISMFVEILYWATFGLAKKRDFKRGAIEQQMFFMGYKAIGIVVLLAFLIGIVLALQAAMQLQRFGAGIYLAPMITISMIKELGPLLTAIILTGRSGSAITAEIATMVVGEETDALQTMGINPLQFIVVPKFYALSITMPVLSLAATTAGIVGGYFVAISFLGISPGLILSAIVKSIRLSDVVGNVVKSIVFSWLIVWVGTYHGFKVHGGAESVGRETTKSVVNGIFIVILADALFSFFV